MTPTARRCPDPDCPQHDIDTGAPFCSDCGTRTELPSAAARAQDPRFLPADVMAGLSPTDAPSPYGTSGVPSPYGTSGVPGPYGTSGVPGPYGTSASGASAPVGAPPSTAVTILVTLLFGLYGLIPAAITSTNEAVAGRPTNRYWAAFGWTLGATIAFWSLLAILVVAAR
ncbi:hypothetical protein [Cellulomonas sp. URHD0024]|uniref:hypothetical protein n=1 Tax=Cellulomonas sp. URHD0024 TaxID=1302620 RepID=UPI0003F75A27|nr:hypothetical protein [Cellulomonas sp. URHD0024]